MAERRYTELDRAAEVAIGPVHRDDKTLPRMDRTGTFALLQFPMVRAWLMEGAQVSDDNIARVAERLLGRVRGQTRASDLIQVPDGIDDALYLRNLNKFCKAAMLDLDGNSGKKIRAIISNSAPGILNVIAGNENLCKHIDSIGVLERVVVEATLLTLTYESIKSVIKINSMLHDRKLLN